MAEASEIEAGASSPASSVPAEEWREIKETDYLYEVSSLGRIRSWKRPGGGGLRRAPLILSPTIGNHGYPVVQIMQGSKRRCRTVQTLVADAFIDRSRGGLEVRHLSGDKLDCRAINLALGTATENSEDSRRHGTLPLGERRANSKLNADRVHRLRFGGESTESLAHEWNMHRGTLDQARRGDTWRHLPMPN